MFKDFNWVDWLILSVLISWALLAIPYVFFGWPAMYGFAKHPAVTAWGQAFGGFVGIGVAIYVPWRQREHVLGDARRSALSLAGYVLSTLRLANARSVWLDPGENQGVVHHLSVAAKLWQSVKLEALPYQSIPYFVGLIALTDEAIVTGGKISQNPFVPEENARKWGALADSAQKYVDKILL
ncbi:MAG: hypothetical protein NTZ15_21075 [Burkholderiales bacterium]|nr:hypothetical protein [Burkholderiales bacterium]